MHYQHPHPLILTTPLLTPHSSLTSTHLQPPKYPSPPTSPNAKLNGVWVGSVEYLVCGLSMYTLVRYVDDLKSLSVLFAFGGKYQSLPKADTLFVFLYFFSGQLSMNNKVSSTLKNKNKNKRTEKERPITCTSTPPFPLSINALILLFVNTSGESSWRM